ncbi:MAG: tandem-95 repeat protein, partial [Chloroflexota bacterium]
MKQPFTHFSPKRQTLLTALMLLLLLLFQTSAPNLAQGTVDAVDDSYLLVNNQDYALPAPGVLSNDTPGTSVIAFDPTTTSGAAVQVNADGSWFAASPGGFTGTVSFTYTIDDGTGAQDTATVVLNYVAPADAFDDSYDLINNQNYAFDAPGLLANDTAGAWVGYADAATTNGLAVSVNSDGSWSVISDPAFSGTTTFTYTVTDVVGSFNTAVVYLNYAAPPPPTIDAVDDSYTLFNDQLYAYEAPGLLANDTPGTHVIGGTTTTTAGSTVFLNSDGSWSVLSPGDFEGSASFSYTIADGMGGQDSATVYLTYEPLPTAVNAVNDTYTLQNTQAYNFDAPGLLANDSPGTSIFTADTQTSDGIQVSVNSDGSWSVGYYPDFTGTTHFSYTITDGMGGQDSATVYLNYEAAFHTEPDHFTTRMEVPLMGANVLSNDFGDGLRVTGSYSEMDVPELGVYEDGTVDYTPPPGFSGTISFVYSVTDVNDATIDVPASITVEDQPNFAPVIESLGAAVNPVIYPGRSTSLTVVASDANGDPLSYQWHTANDFFIFSAPNEPTTLISLSDEVIGGAAAVEVMVSDGYGGSIVGSFQMVFHVPTAEPTNTPTITPTATRTPTATNTPVVTNCAQQAQITQGECNALVNFYNTTNGANWTNHSGWNVTNTPCSWYGIGCSQGHVERIALNNNNLNGQLPALPAFVQEVYFDHNHLVGSIPVLPLTIEYLQLSRNQLTGSIPELPASLQTLILYENQLSGAIPALPPALRSLFLRRNGLSGTIPALPASLEQLEAFSNLLSGEIPALPDALGSLELQNNFLSGEIPALPDALDYLDLSNNQLSGSIPALSPSLGSLDLSFNQLTGTIPTLHFLNKFRVNNNQLSGEVPRSILQVTDPYYSPSFSLCGGANNLYSNDPEVNAAISYWHPLWAIQNRCISTDETETSTPTATPTHTATATATATDTP